MEAIINNIIDQMNQFPLWAIYLFFFVSGFLQTTLPPYPGDSILIFGGYLGAKGLYGGIVPIFFAYWISAWLAGYLLFEVGRWKGEAVLQNKFVLKYVSRQKQIQIQRFGAKHGIWVYLFGKYFPGINFLTILSTGILGYRRKVAYLGILLASLTHDLLFFWAGSTIGRNWDQIARFLTMYNNTVIAVVVGVLLIYLFWRYRNRRRRRLSVNQYRQTENGESNE